MSNYVTKYRLKPDGLEIKDDGHIRVESGGEVDLEAGSALRIAGTQVTASAAELNANDITAPGTVEASKTVVTDTNKDVGNFRNVTAVSVRAGVNGAGGAAGEFVLRDGANPGAQQALVYADALRVISAIVGVGAGYKIARGQHATVAASDTVVTGLTTVVAAVAVLDDDPTVDPLFVTCSIGDQAGAPAAGSILIKSWKPTANNDVTPIAATTFTKNVNWIAIGT